MTPLPESIRTGTFLLIGSGESYETEILPGDQLLDRLIIMIYGTADNCPPAEREQYAKDLANPDNWCHNPDYGPVSFKTGVGETGHIHITRITCPLLPAQNPIARLLAVHSDLLDANPYTYFELAYTKTTDWMAWLCTNAREDDPKRKVIATGQALTPEQACADALAKLKP